MLTSVGRSLRAKLLSEQVKTTGRQSITGSEGLAGLASAQPRSLYSWSGIKHMKSQSYVSAQYLSSHIGRTKRSPSSQSQEWRNLPRTCEININSDSEMLCFSHMSSQHTQMLSLSAPRMETRAPEEMSRAAVERGRRRQRCHTSETPCFQLPRDVGDHSWSTKPSRVSQ